MLGGGTGQNPLISRTRSVCWTCMHVGNGPSPCSQVEKLACLFYGDTSSEADCTMFNFGSSVSMAITRYTHEASDDKGVPNAKMKHCINHGRAILRQMLYTYDYTHCYLFKILFSCYATYLYLFVLDLYSLYFICAIILIVFFYNFEYWPLSQASNSTTQPINSTLSH